MSSNFTFPSPIGGVPFSSDYAPSVLFAILYALLVPAIIWRLVSPRSRNFVLIGTIAFAVERVVIFGLRSEESRNASARTNNNLTIYMQTTLSIGYISIAADLLLLLRSLLVSATLQGAGQSKAKYSAVDPESHEFLNAPYEPGTVPAFASATSAVIEERARERWWYRRVAGSLMIAFWIPFLLGTVAGIVYVKAETDVHKAQLEQQLRYATSATSFVLVTLIQGFALYAAVAVRGVERRPVWLLFGLATLLNIISVYRIVVMRLQTDSLTSMAPGSLNSAGSKAAFYVLHIVSEWLAAATLLSINIREWFETGLWGDQFRPLEKDLLKSESMARDSQ
ncbi:hypothetical protein EIP91_010690 [Steccherinum ochraceum]|uniref:Uncharacterized protein n=1 Tax=Steccherinum ochraceum TaxID=92696 RepID=A0A4R0R8X5_9APHY|nr:hypothetical protein EIP91_010690 [Steccherinum ochraceum]